MLKNKKEKKEKIGYWNGILSVMVLLSIGIVFFELSHRYLGAGDFLTQNIHFNILVLIFIAAGIIVSYFFGYNGGKKDYKGMAVTALKEGKRYKALSVIDGLGSNRKQIYLVLHEEDDKNKIIMLRVL